MSNANQYPVTPNPEVVAQQLTDERYYFGVEHDFEAAPGEGTTVAMSSETLAVVTSEESRIEAKIAAAREYQNNDTWSRYRRLIGKAAMLAA